nr:aminotransferase class I/II-fold pyridoxal phosphate-dependent enzyme [Lachnospiraceae bacterium]
PGIRMGYAVSLPENIDKLSRSLPEWNLSCIASPVMPVCAKITASGDFLHNSVEFIKTEREYLSEGLKGLGLKVYESDTVFVMFKCEADTDLYDLLLKKGILIRNLSDMPGLGRGFYRVAVRDRDDSMRLIDAIGEALR